VKDDKKEGLMPLDVVLYVNGKPLVYGNTMIPKLKFPDLVQPAAAAFHALCDRLKEEEVKEREV
jgi:chorismate-pyruvate lyase